MESTSTETLKAILAKAGLLGVAQGIHRHMTRSELERFSGGLKFYLYNHWISNFPSNTVRLQYLRDVLGIKIGSECFVHMSCFFQGSRITIGDNTVIGRNCFLGGNGGSLTIGSNVSITARTYIFGTTHLVDSPRFEVDCKDVVIEDRAWIGAGAMIMPGVKIGKGAIVGAAAAVTKDVPDFAIFAGVPAKQIGSRSEKLDYVLRYFPYFE
jgi:acetyltransferase-like isoleucine patch superfamily enzyme